MMVALMADGVRTALIEKLDRLARDIVVQENIVRTLDKHGVKLIPVLEPDMGSNDPSRELIRVIFGGIAQYDRKMTVLKLRAARQRIRAAGKRCDGRKPFGITKDEQATLNRMRELFAKDGNYTHVADGLNAEHRPTRMEGKQWNAVTVRRILRRH